MSIDKLQKILENDNPAEHRNIVDILDDDKKVEIVNSVLNGVKIDEDSRSAWLETNREAMKIIKHCEDFPDSEDSDEPVYKAAKVIYPLLTPAIIQLASRMIQHIVRNDRVAECAVLGKDEQIPDPEDVKKIQDMMQSGQMQQQGQQPPQPKMIGRKSLKAKKVADFMNYDLLLKSKTWLKDQHKACHITASWGTSFKVVYRDTIDNKNCSDLIPPEDVIIHQGTTCLEKAKRITIRHYMTKNDIISQIRSGYFVDVDFDTLETQQEETPKGTAADTDPASVVFCQYTYLDLDDDGYAEPYKVYVHKTLNILLGIFPAFETTDKINDVKINEKGEIVRINRRVNLVDDHLIDDPEGGFYSIGLNYLLLHQNKSITSVLRQLLDAGALSNAASCTGFITNAFQPRERNLSFTLGEYKQIDVNPNVNPLEHVIPLPAKEPSQVLLGLLQMMIQGGEKTGFITDVLTGDMTGQNVPATTMLALVEAGTRAFKPVIEKFWMSRKTEFQIHFELYAKHVEATEEVYARFHNTEVMLTGSDFDVDSFDIIPVADPTQSSEAHKYAKMQFNIQLLQQRPNLPELNAREVLLELYEGMEYENPDRFVVPIGPPPPDPKMEQVKINAQKMANDHMIDQANVKISAMKEENERLKTVIKRIDIAIKKDESVEKQRKMIADATRDMAEASVKGRLATVAEKQVGIDQERVEVIKLQAKNKSKGTN